MMKLARVLFWLIVCASLLANAVVLGLAWRAGELREIANGGTAGFADLPQPIRAEFRSVLKENRAALAAPLADLGKARRDMFEAAAARPYDRAAVEAAMARVRAASTTLQVEGQRLLLQAFDQAAAP
jgi:Spy/CpxP family protein refolding chaperone